MTGMQDMEQLSSSTLLSAADWAFTRAVSTVPVVGSARDLAEDYRKDNDTAEKAIDSLIRWQVAKTSGTGFVTNIGGLVTLPVAIPAELSCLFFHQMRMVAAIAYLSGIDSVQDDRVKVVCIGCLAGDAIHNIVKSAGVQFGERLAMNLIRQIPGKVLAEINKAVGMRLVTKFGTTGVVNLGKAVPVLSGAVGAIFDGSCTYGVGKAAKSLFYGKKQ